MTVPTDRLPIWTVAVPFVALGTDLALHGSAGLFAAGVLIVALVAAVMAAVHHAEVVALRVGEPFGAILQALAGADLRRDEVARGASAIDDVGGYVTLKFGDARLRRDRHPRRAA